MVFHTKLSQTKETILMQRSLKIELQIWGSLASHYQEETVSGMAFEGSVNLSAQGQHLVSWGTNLQDTVYSLNQWLIHGTVFLIARHPKTKGRSSLTFGGPLTEFVFYFCKIRFCQVRYPGF